MPNKHLSSPSDNASSVIVDLPTSAGSASLTGTTRKAFVLKLRPGCAAEYERRHNPIWPELERVFRQHGVRSYSIFLCEQSHQLFACLEIEDPARWSLVAETAEMSRWRRYMADVLEYESGGMPVLQPLRQVFSLDEQGPSTPVISLTTPAQF